MEIKRTKVVNRRRSQFDVYIGRPSIWGNPHELTNKADIDERRAVCDKFEHDLQNNPELLAKLPELIGKRLGCFCHPEECHGDRIIKVMKERGLIGMEILNCTPHEIGLISGTIKQTVPTQGLIRAQQESVQNDVLTWTVDGQQMTIPVVKNQYKAPTFDVDLDLLRDADMVIVSLLAGKAIMDYKGEVEAYFAQNGYRFDISKYYIIGNAVRGEGGVIIGADALTRITDL
ncbi:hypothetical protein HNP86_001955 [Methanococcus maripaludis]|uniref:DUF4326 domain-containing protein n=1 Tax=Methanococcus maripaludis TaxID=39152 RepID=A0A7J9P191_METMI|nr:DUF4326 domain-containing protein [Methanococcus maripaludis]MBA2851796.1 hypothetical protein [Methanococcus maripaludis]